MPVRHAGGKCECELQVLCILGVDLIERAVTGARVIFCRPNPLSIDRLRVDLDRDEADNFARSPAVASSRFEQMRGASQSDRLG